MRAMNNGIAITSATIGHQQPTTNNLTQHSALSTDSCVHPIIAQLEQDLSYPWQIAELAAAVSMGRRQLERRFRTATGYSPLGYLRLLRLHKAAELLDTTETPIIQIARQVGMTDKHHFRRSFQQLHRVSPGEYRKLQATCK